MKETIKNSDQPIIELVYRHTKKGQGGEHEGLTKEGEELAREKTREEVMKLIESCEPGSVIVFVGASDLTRTKSTARVSGEELKKIVADRPGEFLILDEKDINQLSIDRKTESTLHALGRKVTANPDKKIIITYPLAMAEFSILEQTALGGRYKGKPEWRTEGAKENPTAYWTEIMRRNNNNEAALVKDWLQNKGRIEMSDGRVLLGPDPNEVVRQYARAFERLEKVTKKLFPNRPLVIGAVAHSWDIDVYITALANGGKLEADKFEEIAKGAGDQASVISMFESPVIRKNPSGQSFVEYRGKTYEIK